MNGTYLYFGNKHRSRWPLNLDFKLSFEGKQELAPLLLVSVFSKRYTSMLEQKIKEENIENNLVFRIEHSKSLSLKSTQKTFFFF